jgi:hypothetical protein
MRFSTASFVVVPLGFFFACGGKVVFDGLPGASGSGGAGGTGNSVSHASSQTVSVVVGTEVATVVVSSQIATVVSTGSIDVATSSTGTSFCDNTGNCGDVGQGCISCAVNGQCSDSYNACIGTQECTDYINCTSNCGGDPMCAQKCALTFPNGAQLYNSLVVCVICNACFNDCQGQQNGCP